MGKAIELGKSLHRGIQLLNPGKFGGSVDDGDSVYKDIGELVFDDLAVYERQYPFADIGSIHCFLEFVTNKRPS